MKYFLVTKTKEGVRLTKLSKNQHDIQREGYELRDGEIVGLEGKFPIFKRKDL